MAAFALEIENAVDHMLDHPWPGDLAFLGHVPDQDDRRASRLGVADHRLRGGAHLRDRAGRRFRRIGPQRLHGIEDDEVRPLFQRQRGEDILDIGLGREFDIGIGGAEPLGAQPYLRDGLLAGDIDDIVALARKRRSRLHEQRRLADAWIAADEQCRAAYDAAAGDPVQFGDA